MAIQIKCPSCEKEIVLTYLNIGEEFKCPHCGTRGTVPASGKPVESFRVSDNVKRTVGGIPGSSTDESTANVEESRFAVVRVLSGIIKVVAWILAAASAIVGIVALKNHDPLAGIGCFVGGTLILIVNLAIAELLLVLLAIEENTRRIPT